MPEDNGLSRDALEIASKLIDLTSQVAITNQSLSHVGEEVRLHNKVIYGDTEKGGLLSKVNMIDTSLNDSQNGLIKQVSVFAEHCNRVITMVERQATSIQALKDNQKNMNRVIYAVAGLLAFILLSLGVFGYKEIVSIADKVITSL